MLPAEGENDGSETDSENDSAAQTTLDEFSQTGEDQQSSILDDEIFLAGLPESIEDGARTSDNPFHCQSGAVRAFENLQQPMAEIRSGVLRDVQQAFDGHIEQTVRNLKEVSRSARLARRAVAPALVTSAVALSTVAGVDAAVIQTMGQLPMQEVTEAVRGMAELNTQSLARMAAQEFQSLSTLAVTQLAEQAAQQLQDVTNLFEQLTTLHTGKVGAMGVVASRSNPFQEFERPVEKSSVQRQQISAPEPANEVVQTEERGLRRVGTKMLEIPPILYAGITGLVAIYLLYQYPGYRAAVEAARYLVMIGIGIRVYLWRKSEL